jgi:hypothetical protein
LSEAGAFAQELPNAGSSAAITSTESPQALTGTSSGACTVLPDSAPGESLAAPPACEPAIAGLPHRDRMLVAAAAATIPLLRVWRNLVVFLLEEVGKAGPERLEDVRGRPCTAGRLLRYVVSR